MCYLTGIVKNNTCIDPLGVKGDGLKWKHYRKARLHLNCDYKGDMGHNFAIINQSKAHKMGGGGGGKRRGVKI